MTDLDTKPWYRQFWPWFLICLPASAVIASLYTVSLAFRTTDSLVVTSDDGMDVVAETDHWVEVVRKALGLKELRVVPTGGDQFQQEREHLVAVTTAFDAYQENPARVSSTAPACYLRRLQPEYEPKTMKSRQPQGST